MPSQKLNDKDLKVRIFVEEFFWTQGRVPSNKEIIDHFGPFITEKYLTGSFWKNPVVRRGLVASGVDVSKENTDGLEPKQMIAANVMLNINDRRSTRKKLQEVGITTQVWNGWLREPRFVNYLKARTEAMFGSSDWIAYDTLVKRMQDGNFDATKLFFEMKGIYNPKIDINVNVEVVVNQLIEIVAKHVGDPEILMAIAADVEELDIGPKKALPSPVGRSNPVVAPNSSGASI